MQSRTAVFSKLVEDLMRRVRLAVPSGTPLGDTVARMARVDASSAVVVGAAGQPIGIVTERDITRRAAFKRDPATAVEAVMTAPVSTIRADEYLYYAIARMRRAGLRHMPVVDDSGRLVGMLDLHDALAAVSQTLMAQIDALTQDSSIDGLKQVKSAEAELAQQLLDENLPATEILALLTHINNDICRRVVDLELAAMADEGLGTPPVEFSVIVMGSSGRGENFLFPDQDNGMILAPYPDDRHAEIDRWFIELAERMTRDLDAVGVPKCKGDVMATNPLWRKTLPQWKEQVGRWSRKRNIAVVRLSDIFFDFRCVWGDPAMADELRQFVTAAVRGNPAFLREMFADDADHGVALGWFGRFITEKEKEAFKGQMNLKHAGTLPLVETMRIMALREGIVETSTLGRMDALKAKGLLTADDHDYLVGAFRHIARLLLQQQLRDYAAGKPVSNYVPPESLTERERDILIEGFRAIRTVRRYLQSEMTGELF
jgi:signal-transduction protein with cAMP-binding, CBS, and nucleotidyltransferase domain